MAEVNGLGFIVTVSSRILGRQLRYNARMSKSLDNPHDRFFRETFSRREVAEGFLRGYLPSAVADKIDWASLAIAKDSFIEKALRQHFSDLLYSVRHGAGEIKIYLLVEHKSHPDAWVPLQLLRYQLRIWELHRKQKPKDLVPPILPLVLYHGSERWQTPDRFLALFGEMDAALLPYIPDFRHVLCDLSLPAPRQIKDAVLSRLVLLALKHIFDPNPKQALAEVLPLVRKILDKETSLEMLEVVLRYYVQTTQVLDERDIRELLTQTDDEEGIMPTFIDQYIEQGRQEGLFIGMEKGREEGLEKGIEKGIEKGREVERRALLLRLLRRKFGQITPAQQHRIKQADSETLLRWSEEVLFAVTADEALR
jgi:predicted transposase/invertase (TIGR01784 family)